MVISKTNLIQELTGQLAEVIHRVDLMEASLVFRPRSFRQLGDVGADTPGLVAGERQGAKKESP